jgi:uncharacterized protein DUF4233
MVRAAGWDDRMTGLRDPAAAVRGVGTAALAAQALVLLLAIMPMRVLHVRAAGGLVVALVALSVSSLVLAGLLRRRWAWHAASVLQVGVVAAGLVWHASLVVVGVLFGLVWAYVLYVRRSVLG